MAGSRSLAACVETTRCSAPHWCACIAAARPRAAAAGAWSGRSRSRPTYRAIDGDGDRLPVADIDRFDAGTSGVTQPRCLGTLGEAALLAGFDQGEATFASAQEFDGADGVGEAGIGAREEDEARLLVSDRRGRGLRATDGAEDAGGTRDRNGLGRGGSNT